MYAEEHSTGILLKVKLEQQDSGTVRQKRRANKAGEVVLQQQG